MTMGPEARLPQGREPVRLPPPYFDRFLRETPEALRVERRQAIEAGQRLARVDRAIFASLGHTSDVSIASLGVLPVKDMYNVRVPTEQTNPEVIKAAETVLVGCADIRLTGLQQQLADIHYNGDTSKVLPVLIAGGVVQPHRKELESGLDTSFTSTSREDDLRTVVDYIVRTHQEGNSNKPLRVIFSGHDEGCAFVTKMFGGQVNEETSPRVIITAMDNFPSESPETALMSSFIVTHGARYQPPGVEVSYYLFTPREGRPVYTMPLQHAIQQEMRLVDATAW